MIQRFLGALVAASLVATSGAQISFDKGQTILVPGSSVAKRGKFNTHLLNNLSKPTMPHVADALGVHPMLAIGGYYPADLRSAYRLPADGGTGVIAIVDAFHNPTALSDFNVFANQFGLPKETSTNPLLSTNKVFQIVYASGKKPANDSTGWASEMCLDMEWAHAMAPKAKIIVVESDDDSDTAINAAINVAKAITGVHQVSMSFGSDESVSTVDTTEYNQTGVTFFASTGDTANERSYPALFPNVIGVGGTKLLFSSGVVTSETAWSSSGGGPSTVIARPTFQNIVSAIVGTKRGSPDISALADPATGAAVYSTWADSGWTVYGGTSLACPLAAGIANVRGAYSTSSATENSRNYINFGGPSFRDIKSGVTGVYHAVAGYDFITGCGSPVGLLPTTQASTAGVAVTHGTLAAGVLANLKSVEALTYDIASTPYGTAYGEYASANVLVRFASPASSYSKLYVYVTASSTLAATSLVYVYNYTTHAYVLLGSLATGTSAKTFIASLTPAVAANYFDTTKAIHLMIRSHTPGNNTTVHTYKLDQVAAYGLP